MNRLHPQDLRAIVAAIQTVHPDKPDDSCAIRWADSLLAELERTANPEPNRKDYEYFCNCGRPWVETDKGAMCPVCANARADAAEAQLAEVKAELDAAIKEMAAGNERYCAMADELAEAKAEVERFKSGFDSASKAHLACCAIINDLKAEAERWKLSWTNRDAEANQLEADMFAIRGEQAVALRELVERRNYMSLIDAAKAGEPPMPPYGPGEYHKALLMTQGWGRQGWEAAAALRVELDGVTNENEATGAHCDMLRHDLDEALAKLARYEAAEGEIPEVPNGPYSRSWPEMHKLMTDLRARLVKATEELAEVRECNALFVAGLDEAKARAREEGQREERERIISALAFHASGVWCARLDRMSDESQQLNAIPEADIRAALEPKEVQP